MSESKVSFDLTFSDRGLYLHALVRANAAEFETALAYWTRIIQKCREIDSERVLVERDIPGHLSTVDMFNLTTALAAMNIQKIKIAVSDPAPENYDTNRFAELAGSNRGANGRVFATLAEAEAWLLESDP